VKFVLALLVVAVVGPSGSQTPKLPIPSQLSGKVQLFRHHSTIAWVCGSSVAEPFVFEAGLAVDADGAFKAYHPNNRLGLDSIEHAGHPGNWWALATDTGDPSGRPVVQGKRDPAPGYYVSMTSLFDAANPNERDPHRFVDAARIPYVVLPPIGLKHAKLGDFAAVVNLQNGEVAGAIVADESAPDLRWAKAQLPWLLLLASIPIREAVESRVGLLTSSIRVRETASREGWMRLSLLHDDIFKCGVAYKN
jgi:hypothetical protein